MRQPDGCRGHAPPDRLPRRINQAAILGGANVGAGCMENGHCPITSIMVMIERVKVLAYVRACVCWCAGCQARTRVKKRTGDVCDTSAINHIS